MKSQNRVKNKLRKLKIEEQKAISEFHDKFAVTYNEKQNKQNALAVLQTNHEAFKQRVERLNTIVETEIHLLEMHLDHICKREFYSDLEEEVDKAGEFFRSLSKEEKKNIFDEVKKSDLEEVELFDQKKASVSTKEALKIKKDLLTVINGKFKDDTYKTHPQSFLDYCTKQLDEIYKTKDLGVFIGRLPDYLYNIISIGQKVLRTEYQLAAINAVIADISDGGFPKKLDLDKDPKEEQRKNFEESSTYVPHHNTREGLVEDLRDIIEEIESNPHYFNEDGSIKHVSVSKYAVEKKWFSKKYDDPSQEGLYKHVKRIYKMEY